MPKGRTRARGGGMAAANGPSPRSKDRNPGHTQEKGDPVKDEERLLEDVIGQDHAAKAHGFPYGKTNGNLWRALGWQFMGYEPLTNPELQAVVVAMQSRLGVSYDWSRVLPGGNYMGACCSTW
ncbi:MAG: hypothetical protein OJF52_004425 [Nitrospira sp.]|nr:MAG: hypothetical protein OJF52_004425 [Nitrospira sp.]